jgi:NAD(P)-dependent dehydrogenase (short-subunit alcohol dehydrogenase family)
MEATARFCGQVVLVTGGTGALGSAVTRAFLQEGASVAVTYRTRQEYENLQSSLATDAARLRGHPTDVTNEAEMLRAIAAIEEEFHRLDGLVSTVGGWSGGTKLWEAERATLERMLDLNLRSAFVCARTIVPMLLRQGRGGYVINVAARAALDQPAGAGAYAASKAAAVALMHSLAMDLKDTGIRVNSILPNIIDTPANRRAMPRADFGSWTTPEQIARVILFLCTPDARPVNGAAIPV